MLMFMVMLVLSQTTNFLTEFLQHPIITLDGSIESLSTVKY